MLFDLHNIGFLFRSPLFWIGFLFQLWMFIDAIRRREFVWAVFIFLFSVISALLYFFLVYRQASPLTTRGFELPGSSRRERIKELQGQIHHLDQAYHHSQLGDVYFGQGKLAQAETCYRAALERDAEDHDTRAHLGQCLLRQNNPGDARPLLHGVCAQDPKHDYGHSLMAFAETLTALGEIDAAIDVWKHVNAHHSYSRARVQLAELLASKNEPAAARDLIEEVLEDAPHTPAFQKRRDRYWVKRASRLKSQLPA
jgi:hypothetical protein